MLAMAVILLATILTLPPGDSNGILVVYSLWAAVAGLSFLAHATEAGIYYMVAAVLFAASIVMALTPQWAPLEIAFLMTANMTSQAIYLRGLTKERPAAKSGPISSASTVTQYPYTRL
jgi:hypothetical protein